MQCANGEPLENLVQEDNITGFVFRTKKPGRIREGRKLREKMEAENQWVPT